MIAWYWTLALCLVSAMLGAVVAACPIKAALKKKLSALLHVRASARPDPDEQENDFDEDRPRL